jgi:hypothetical protein
MGILDSLRKLFEPIEPPVMEARRVRYEWGVMRLPEGWQFTLADFREIGARGPGGCSMVITFRPVMGAVDDEQKLEKFSQAMRSMVKDPSARVTQTPGVGLWVEATPTTGTPAVLRIAIFRFSSRTPGASRPPLFDVNLSVPMSHGDVPRVAEVFDQLRSALRAIEWS